MKTVASRTQTLERANTALKVQVQQLQVELQRVQEMYKLSWTQSNRGHSRTVVQRMSTEISASAEVQKSYLRPTFASINRMARPDLTVSATHAPHRTPNGLDYDDGKLIATKDLDQANFLKPTQAFLSKASRPSGIHNGGWSGEHSSGVDWSSENPWFNASAPDHDQSSDDASRDSVENSLSCVRCDSIDARDEDPGDSNLKIRSRLNDNEFYNAPASTCFVPFKLQMRLLRASLRLAQETLWNALREHWPRLQRSIYLEGPEEVKFGRDELHQGFGDEMYPSEANEMCGHPRSRVLILIFDVVYLRNAVCHPGHHPTERVDKLIRHAQALAVILQDERRAFKIRQLRDELQAEIVKSYQEIEAHVGLASLPFAKPWPVHHQRLFNTVRLDHKLGDHTDYPDIVKRASREWQLKHSGPAELDPRYLANVEKAKMYMRLAERGRRASVPTLHSSKIDVHQSSESTIEDQLGLESVVNPVCNIGSGSGCSSLAEQSQGSSDVTDGW